MELKPYDLVFVKGNTLLDRIIKSRLKSKYSHVGMMLDDKHIVETGFNVPLSIRHFHYTDYDIVRVNFTDKQKEKLKEFIFKTLQSRYDLAEIAAYLGFYFADKANEYICISWTEHALQYAGFKLSNIKKFEDIINQLPRNEVI